MSYQVLARKWRPKVFREMVGQEHVLQALINALDHNRLHHAYLFTGTRGVGKTTIARILAKCLNCEQGVSSEPCGTCSACKEISDGRFVDLIEVDAASRTKVEDTRELLDNVQYAPTRGRYKIYIIDEVHMLSSHSFNALLKTLEEPPEHVKFLLATTDPQKLPVTILSRCLQFNLKNMSAERIVTHLQHVLSKELVPFDAAALWLLARSADGSMRDALSLTDQAISFGNGKVAEIDVMSMLGTIDQRLIQQIIEAFIAEDGATLLTCVAQFAEQSPDYSSALSELLSLLHRIAIAQALPEALDNSYGDKAQILDYALKLAPEDVQLFYQTALVGRRDLNFASSARAGFEMTLLRMLAFKPQGVADVPVRPLAVSSATNNKASLNHAAKTENLESMHEAGAQENVAAEQVVQQGVEQEHAFSEKNDVSESTPDPLQPAEPTVEVEPASVKKLTAIHDVQAHEVPSSAEAIVESLATTPQVESGASSGEGTNETQESLSATVSKPDVHALRAQIKEIEQSGPNKHPADDSSINKVTAQESVGAPVLSLTDQHASEEAKCVSLNDMSPHHWISLNKALQIKGILSSTVSNAVLISCAHNVLHFVLDETKASLFDASHGQRLSDILSDYFKEPVKATIALGQTPAELETPADYHVRKQKEMRVEAIEILNNDAVVANLREHFGATLDENSIKIE